MRKTCTPTNYPGVFKIGPGLFRVRAKVIDPRTGAKTEIDREVEAANARAASAIREQLRKEALATGRAPDARPKVEALLLSWLRSKLPELKTSTRRHYAHVIDKHIIPKLGGFYLDAIGADDVIAWRDAQSGKPPTINSRLRVLKTFLADVTHERGMHDPAARVHSVREGRRTEPKGLPPHELGTVLEKLRELTPQWHAIAFVKAVTGQRWGAVSALEWDRIDWQRGAILFDRAHVRGVLDEQKTGAIVDVPLVPELREILEAHRAELRRREKRRRERRSPGTVVLETAGLEGRWVFPSRRGGLMQPSSLRGPLAAACAAAGVRTISPHGLRYSFNHAAKRAAASDVVRSITGHVTEQMTTHYDWIPTEEKRAAVAGVVRLLAGNPAEGGDAGGDAVDGKETAG